MESKRFWLTFPTELITEPIVYKLGKEFELVTNIRQASVTSEIGIISLEVTGEREEIKRAVSWLEGQGIQVEPVEIQIIEG